MIVSTNDHGRGSLKFRSTHPELDMLAGPLPFLRRVEGAGVGAGAGGGGLSWGTFCLFERRADVGISEGGAGTGLGSGSEAFRFRDGCGGDGFVVGFVVRFVLRVDVRFADEVGRGAESRAAAGEAAAAAAGDVDNPA